MQKQLTLEKTMTFVDDFRSKEELEILKRFFTLLPEQENLVSDEEN